MSMETSSMSMETSSMSMDMSMSILHWLASHGVWMCCLRAKISRNLHSRTRRSQDLACVTVITLFTSRLPDLCNEQEGRL
jgi:hypothetical protein